MTHPQPDRTPQGPRYQGRLLPRPDDDVVDQGLGFDVATLFNRRRMLRAMGLGAGALALAACGADNGSATGSTGSSAGSSTSSAANLGSGSAGSSADNGTSGSEQADGELVEIPDETNGPYPADGTNGPNILQESGIVRQDIRSSFGSSTTIAEGVPLDFTFTVLDMANGGVPFAGVAVYAWQCDRAGRYSMYSDGVTEENYLRGVQIADDNGKVTFTSIVPACYTGRWPHIHFEVYPDQESITDQANAISTSQLAIPKNVCDAVFATEGYEQSVTNLAQLTLATDNVFGDDGGIHQIASMTGDVDQGYVATLTVPIDTTTEPTSGGGGIPGGGGPGGGGPGGSGPGGAGTPPSDIQPPDQQDTATA